MRYTMNIDGWRIDAAARTAERDGKMQQLSPRAIRLLTALADADGAMLSRRDLLDRVWPNVLVTDESLTQVVSELRRKLANRDLIATVARSGYRLTVPVASPSERIDIAGSPHDTGLTLDAYTLCIEAKECFARGLEGAHRSFVDLTAQAVAAAPTYAEARALHALALMKRHCQWSEGEDLFEAAMEETAAALALDPHHGLAHLLEAVGFFLDGRAVRAIPALEAALGCAQNDSFIHLNAGLALLSIGNRRGAAALVARAGQLQPNSFGADALLSRIVLRSDPLRSRVAAKRALSMVRQELTVDPYSMRALYALGPLLALVGDRDGARKALENVAHHDSPEEYFRALGFALIGDFSSALERLDFLAMRGWRHVSMLSQDAGFRSMFNDNRFRTLQKELVAA
ncbi:MAG: winged helix-turn-helix domain-containing protein [Hyphomonas sp.]|nr:winged helix-turn-helix domain-containing protein [Hyphomonas sp.]